MGHHNHFERNRKSDHHYYRKDYHHSYENDHDESLAYYPSSIGYYAGNILSRLRSSGKLQIILLISVIIIVALIILALILIIPLLGGLFDIIKQTGLKGMIDTITQFLLKLWNGS